MSQHQNFSKHSEEFMEDTDWTDLAEGRDVRQTVANMMKRGFDKMWSLLVSKGTNIYQLQNKDCTACS
jgi:hypothetical protein